MEEDPLVHCGSFIHKMSLHVVELPLRVRDTPSGRETVLSMLGGLDALGSAQARSGRGDAGAEDAPRSEGSAIVCPMARCLVHQFANL